MAAHARLKNEFMEDKKCHNHGSYKESFQQNTILNTSEYWTSLECFATTTLKTENFQNC